LGVLLTIILAGVISTSAIADELPPNVDKASHRWLKKEMPRALPKLIQTARGPMQRKHIYVIDELGNWGAPRGRRSYHQGTDFVLDVPHKHKPTKTELYVGSLINGRVAHVKTNWGAYGSTVFLVREQDPKMVFIFAHLDTVKVKEGQKVNVGDRLGVFGCTGNCRTLRHACLKHQVHVEIYALPKDFKRSDIKWSHLPLGQLRKRAIHNAGRRHGVNLGAYMGRFKLQDVTRQELAERYEKNLDAGGLARIVGKKSKKKKKK